MQEATELISLRVPKSMGRDMNHKVKSEGYASRTELVREALREKLYKNAYESLKAMRGALKGKVKAEGSMRTWRLKMWNNALKKAKGDHHKAVQILKQDERDAIKGLRL
ncbi:MAG: ribbon-helix-helix domain-containing protein [Candidatus Micrarchaeota archaeon]|nr:ribbon-helix-helix domain-containing protein [Candidatus Micrarchaeota archaeon]